MLKTRIITALVLLAVILPTLFWAPVEAWAVLVAVAAAAGAWEWGGLLGMTASNRLWLAGEALGMCLLGILLGLTQVSPGHPLLLALLIPSALFWLGFAPFWLRRQWPLRQAGTSPGILLGAIVLLPTWLALVQLRNAGPLALLLVMAIVWIADIAAYFFGRNFGRNKLAPSVSPGKTWEGAYGAVGTVLLYGFAVREFLPPALGQLPTPVFAVALVLLAAVSIVGDLFESLLKRQAGLKDSSQLLPGHGGVLDRIDSLTSTLPLVALLALL
jgi:phosphatidate cytidylyltransferase